MRNTCFPSGRLKVGTMPGREGLCDQHPQNTLGPEFLMSFLVGNTSQVLSQLIVGLFKVGDVTARGPLEAHACSPLFCIFSL